MTPEPMDNGGNWKDTYLPEELRSDKVFEPIQDVPNLAKAYANLSHLQGKSVKIPDAKASDQELDSFYSKLRPESPEKYEIKPSQLPEGFDYDKEIEQRFLGEVAYKVGLSNRQAQGIIDWWNNAVVATTDEVQKEREGAENALRQEWGRDFDGNTGLAKQTALKFGGQEYADSFSGLDNTTKKILAQVGKMTGNDRFVQGQSAGMITKDEAQAKIDEIWGNKEHPYHKRDRPGHDRAVQEMYKLNEVLAG